jgi:hypothetical protein
VNPEIVSSSSRQLAPRRTLRVKVVASLRPSMSLTQTGPAPGGGGFGAVSGCRSFHRPVSPRAMVSGAGHGEVRLPRRKQAGVRKHICQARAKGQRRSASQEPSSRSLAGWVIW